ncbi:MAG: alpha-E domain-containing protein [Acidimicrobiales bacterium]|nr:alpha-E domain-containing protein [Acidimicrobiales bacterium]
MMYHTPAPLLLSRIAEHAYWAGRYLERAEGTARLVSTHSDLIVDLPRAATVGWRPLLAVLGVDPAEVGVTDFPAEEDVIGVLVADDTYPGSVRSSVAAVFRNLRQMRAVLPADAVELLIELHHRVEDTASDAIDRRTRRAWLTAVIRSCQTLTAVLNETMSHDDAYCFFTVGRQLERADLTTRVLDVQGSILTRRATGPLEPYLDLCFFAALRSVGALQPFRRTGVPPSAEATVSFLLQDPKCPRTVEHCLVEAGRWLLEIPGHAPAMAACAAVQRTLHDVDALALVSDGTHEIVDELQRGIAEIHDQMTASWFLPAGAQAMR